MLNRAGLAGEGDGKPGTGRSAVVESGGVESVEGVNEKKRGQAAAGFLYQKSCQRLEPLK